MRIRGQCSQLIPTHAPCRLKHCRRVQRGVGGERYRPIPWLVVDHVDNAGDRPWSEIVSSRLKYFGSDPKGGRGLPVDLHRILTARRLTLGSDVGPIVRRRLCVALWRVRQWIQLQDIDANVVQAVLRYLS